MQKGKICFTESLFWNIYQQKHTNAVENEAITQTQITYQSSILTAELPVSILPTSLFQWFSLLKIWLKPSLSINFLRLKIAFSFFIFFSLWSRDSWKSKSIPYVDRGNQLEDNVCEVQLKWLGRLVGSRVTWKTHNNTLYMCSLAQRGSQNANTSAYKCQTTPSLSQIYRITIGKATCLQVVELRAESKMYHILLIDFSPSLIHTVLF